VRGPQIFAGYWNNPAATAEVLVDGWLHTGDLGSVDEDGFVTVTGRKKDIIITSGGKNITPANLENDLRQAPWISHAIMYGDRTRWRCSPWTPSRSFRGLVSRVCPQTSPNSPPTRRCTRVQAVVDEANARYAKVAQVKKFTILGHDLSPETGELTATLKVNGGSSKPSTPTCSMRSTTSRCEARAFETLRSRPETVPANR
jgi:long-chain acyl-CoA synthetase